MKRIKLLLFILPFTLTTFAQKPEQLIAKGNDCYKNSQFDSAIVCYEKVVAQGYVAADLYFNLGNAYYKTRDLSKSILYYEKAKKLKPNNDEINFNLQLAQTMIVDKINVLPDFFVKRWLHNIINMQTSDGWAHWSIIAFAIALLLLLVYLISNSMAIKKSFFWLAVLALIVSTFSFVQSYKLKQLLEAHDTAIVQTPSINIKSSPDEKGTDLFVIHEGTKVTIIDEVGEWREIKISDGNKGWLKISDIALI
jgi:tetratricopeptide (TPR) repeat protein